MPPLSNKQIFFFWAPLAAMWVMMASEWPVLTAIIARTSDAKINLAAFGVSFAISLIIESPVIAVLSTTIALLGGAKSYAVLRRFNFALMALSTFGMLLINHPSVFFFLTRDVMTLTPEVSTLAHYATCLMIPWPAAIGYRRLYQGVLIKHNHPAVVMRGTVARIVSMSITGFALYLFTSLPGACIGAASLSLGVICESLATRIMANEVVAQVTSSVLESDVLSLRTLIHFYLPLTFTVIIEFVVKPLITFSVGRAPLPIESLAVLPVTGALLFLIQSLSLAIQETVMVLSGERFANLTPVLRFGGILGMILSLVLALVALSPLSVVWFEQVAGLTPDLRILASESLKISLAIPMLSVIEFAARGILVRERVTALITVATILETVCIGAMLYLAIAHWNLAGVYAAPLATLSGILVALAFLLPQAVKRVRAAQMISS